MSILTELRDRFRQALSELIAEPDAYVEMVRATEDPRFGDYQANCAMPLAKSLGRAPRDVAAEIVRRLNVADLCQAPQIAGPGFINLRVRDDWLAARLAAAVADDRLGIARTGSPRTYVIDYSAPNVAKPMHVGHIRSTVIGDCLARTLDFLGHRVIRDNHLGDWGTQFGMILYGYKRFVDPAAYQRAPVAELARLYRMVRELADQNAEVASAVLAETAKLHAGDAENLRLWRQFLPHSLRELDRVYARLGVQFDYTLGERFYHDRLPGIVEELLRLGIARESDGAVCIFFEDLEPPMIIRKQDGAFLYATTDLATLRYRMETWRPDAILYVVDVRQSLHFRQLFAAARRWGYRDVDLVHVSFGTVLGDDGRPFRTREGDIVGLESLLDEAVRRALAVVEANDKAKPNGPELSPEQRERVAEVVGIGALKYRDLSQNRTSDYVFDFDKMLAMTGNTGTYMQYAYARIRSIFAKGQVDVERLRATEGGLVLATHPERALALAILHLAEAVELTLADYRPNQLTAYLFELANRFTTFYEQCPVLAAESESLRRSRLLLCDLTARTIRLGLGLLGIEVVDKM